ncbi:hypothetical protein BS47DRAFT_1144023 [Hydnum rufescens UP504]|uniref:Uncharacterized protein n=1 Tax=Hydnum rufescens UP504 TaxID=1448309 RepID=A0A9P6ATZ6_9AGAM|nr:hypothetical protein BS47DRAFT_1144023 [Hydnum rufescens UP504]
MSGLAQGEDQMRDRDDDVTVASAKCRRRQSDPGHLVWLGETWPGQSTRDVQQTQYFLNQFVCTVTWVKHAPPGVPHGLSGNAAQFLQCLSNGIRVVIHFFYREGDVEEIAWMRCGTLVQGGHQESSGFSEGSRSKFWVDSVTLGLEESCSIIRFGGVGG